MKNLFVFTLIFFVFTGLRSQIPQSFNYQVIPRNGSGGVYPEQSMGLQLSIIANSPGGTAVYIERFTRTTTSLGLINLQIGTGTPVTGIFSTISWSTGTYYLKVEIDVAGGTSYTDMGTTQLISVPYAMYAKEAANGFSGAYSDLSGKPSKIGDFSGDMNNKIIYNLADPVATNDASTKAYVDKLANDMEAVAITTGGLVKDYDGNSYKTLKIGEQNWMASDLKTTHFNNGDPIQSTNPATQNITGEPTPKYQWAPQGNEANIGSYGRLYTWYAATDPRGVCPAGWHVATNGDWEQMVDFLGGTSVAGEKLREAGVTHWHTGNTGTNSSGFTALPGGFKAPEGPFYWFSEGVYFWTSTESSATQAYRPAFHYDWAEIDMGSSSGKQAGHSVRCVLNNEINKTYEGTVKMAGIKMSTGAGTSKILTSDSEGNGSWQDPAVQIPVGLVPVGGVVAWFKDMIGTPALPANFAECNGQTINDPSSPFNGATLPDLNAKFLMGSSSSGGTGGSAVHAHPGSVTNASADFPVTARTDVPMSGTSAANHTHTLSISSAQNIPPYYTVVWIIRIK